jgi:hypothetical protein
MKLHSRIYVERGGREREREREKERERKRERERELLPSPSFTHSLSHSLRQVLLTVDLQVRVTGFGLPSIKALHRRCLPVRVLECVSA